MTLRIFLVLVVASFVGCSQYLKIAVINNTDEVITAHDMGREIVAGPGETAEFVYPGEISNHTVRITAGGCSHIYFVPKSPALYYDHDGFDGVIVTQLEKNLRLYLAPPIAESPSDPADLEPIQSDDFPISPLKSICS